MKKFNCCPFIHSQLLHDLPQNYPHTEKIDSMITNYYNYKDNTFASAKSKVWYVKDFVKLLVMKNEILFAIDKQQEEELKQLKNKTNLANNLNNEK